MLFLVSPAAAYVTGATVPVDGGCVVGHARSHGGGSGGSGRGGGRGYFDFRLASLFSPWSSSSSLIITKEMVGACRVGVIIFFSSSVSPNKTASSSLCPGLEPVPLGRCTWRRAWPCACYVCVGPGYTGLRCRICRTTRTSAGRRVVPASACASALVARVPAVGVCGAGYAQL